LSKTEQENLLLIQLVASGFIGWRGSCTSLSRLSGQ